MYSRDRLIKAIDNSACLTRRQINDYLQHKLFPEELYVVEMHLNECPFCNDAIEGFAKVNNANALLSNAEDFTPSAIAPKKNIITTPNPVVPTNKPTTETTQQESRKPAQNISSTSNSFEEPKKSRKIVPWGIAAGIVAALAVWGISNMGKKDATSETILADASSANNESSLDDGMFNESSINRREDSIMNAKYGFQNQEPLSAEHGVRRMAMNSTSQSNDSNAVSLSDVMDETPAVVASSKTADKSSSFVGPVMPRDEEQRRAGNASVEKAKTVAAAPKPSAAEQSKTKAIEKAPTVAAKDASKNKVTTTTAAPPTTASAKEAKSSKETAAKETAAKETAKPSANPAIIQAEKDYKKGLELYNKKQYSASIMYFQSAAKVKDFPNKSKAESYIKLAKSEVVNAERKKNSEK